MATLNDIVNQLINLYTQDCKHRSKYGYAPNHTCHSFVPLIRKALDKNFQLPNNITDQYYEYIFRHEYYNDDSCIKNGLPQHISLLNDLFSQNPPNIDNFKVLLTNTQLDSTIKEIPNNILNTPPYINAIIETRFLRSDYYSLGTSTDEKNFINIFLEKIQITSDILKRLVGCYNKNLAARLAIMIDKTNVNLTNIHLEEACTALPPSRPVIASLISRGLSLTDKHLEIACKTGDAESINYLINTGKIKVSQKHFNEIITSKKYQVSNDPYSFRYAPGRIQIKHNVYIHPIDAYDPVKIDVLIKNGYVITRDDLLFSIKNKKELPKIDQFGIKFDKSILDACWDADFYPTSYKFDCITEDQIQLQKLCGTRRPAEIKKLMKANPNLIVDRKCMENACTFASNSIYDYLKSKGGVPTMKCIENIANVLNNNKLLVQVVSDFKQINDAEILNYKNRIAELEKQVGKKQITVKDIESEEIKEPKTEIKKSKESKESKESKKSKEPIQKDINSKTEIKEPATIYIDLDIPNEKMNEIQKNHRIKKLATDKMKKILKIKIKAKLTYSEVRNLIIQKIKEENWIDKKDKNIIHIPENVMKILALNNKDNNIQFSDIDKLVCLLY